MFAERNPEEAAGIEMMSGVPDWVGMIGVAILIACCLLFAAWLLGRRQHHTPRETGGYDDPASRWNAPVPGGDDR